MLDILKAGVVAAVVTVAPLTGADAGQQPSRPTNSEPVRPQHNPAPQPKMPAPASPAQRSKPPAGNLFPPYRPHPQSDSKRLDETLTKPVPETRPPMSETNVYPVPNPNAPGHFPPGIGVRQARSGFDARGEAHIGADGQPGVNGTLTLGNPPSQDGKKTDTEPARPTNPSQ
jgi:hypothetical protein